MVLTSIYSGSVVLINDGAFIIIPLFASFLYIIEMRTANNGIVEKTG